MMPCLTCHHAWRFHSQESHHCRTTGCPCTEYADPQAKGDPELQSDDGRMMMIYIPEGYVLNMQLVPTEAEVADADAG